MTKDEENKAIERMLAVLNPEGDEGICGAISETKLEEAEIACFIHKNYELSNKLLDELGLCMEDATGMFVNPSSN